MGIHGDRLCVSTCHPVSWGTEWSWLALPGQGWDVASLGPGGPGGPPRGEAGGLGGRHAVGLTIMFSRACLASQQFRNTGMNRFRSGAQNICREDGSGGWGLGWPVPQPAASPTVMMKGSVLIISSTKETRKICSQTLPWGGGGEEEKDRPTLG